MQAIPLPEVDRWRKSVRVRGRREGGEKIWCKGERKRWRERGMKGGKEGERSREGKSPREKGKTFCMLLK